MDYEADFRQVCLSVAAQLSASGGPANGYKGHHGWDLERFEQRSRVDARGHETSWGYTVYFLSISGEIMIYSFSHYPDGNEASVATVPSRSLVGAKGKPFAEWKAKVERLPYTTPPRRG